MTKWIRGYVVTEYPRIHLFLGVALLVVAGYFAVKAINKTLKINLSVKILYDVSVIDIRAPRLSELVIR